MDSADARVRAGLEIINHNSTRGALAENLLRDMLSEFLPLRLLAGTGFILSEKGSSKQIDLLVFDQMENAAIYKDGNLLVISPGTARLAVEVKSRLEGDAIKEAMTNIASAKSMDSTLPGFIFGFKSATMQTIKHHIEEWIKENPEFTGRRLMPDRIYCAERKFMVVLDEEGKVLYRFMEPEKPIVRYFFAEALTRIGLERVVSFMTAPSLPEATLEVEVPE